MSPVKLQPTKPMDYRIYAKPDLGAVAFKRGRLTKNDSPGSVHAASAENSTCACCVAWIPHHDQAAR